MRCGFPARLAALPSANRSSEASASAWTDSGVCRAGLRWRRTVGGSGVWRGDVATQQADLPPVCGMARGSKPPGFRVLHVDGIGKHGYHCVLLGRDRFPEGERVPLPRTSCWAVCAPPIWCCRGSETHVPGPLAAGALMVYRLGASVFVAHVVDVFRGRGHHGEGQVAWLLGGGSTEDREWCSEAVFASEGQRA